MVKEVEGFLSLSGEFLEAFNGKGLKFIVGVKFSDNDVSQSFQNRSVPGKPDVDDIAFIPYCLSDGGLIQWRYAILFNIGETEKIIQGEYYETRHGSAQTTKDGIKGVENRRGKLYGGGDCAVF